jgi:predicted PurR-regulated permease PerM
MLTVVLSILFYLLWVLRSAIFPFLLGMVIAYVLWPSISWFEKKFPGKTRWHGLRRVLIIIIIYLLVLAIVGVLAYYLISAIVNSVTTFMENAPDYFSAAAATLQKWLDTIRLRLPPNMQTQVDQYLQQWLASLGDAIRTTLATGISMIPTTVGLILGLAVLPVFLFFVLKDWEELAQGFYSSLPAWAAPHAKNIVEILQDILGRYVRANLLLGFVVGLLDFIGLLVLRVPSALLLGVFGGITEVVPTIGPLLGGLVAVLVTLAIDPGKAIWVALLFTAVQLVENYLLVPRVQAGFMHIHPVLIIVLLVVGTNLAGFWGLILAVPFTTLIVQLYRYFYRAAMLEDGHASTEQGRS